MFESSLTQFRQKVNRSTAASGGGFDEGGLGFEALDSPNTVAVAVFPNSSRDDRDLSQKFKNPIFR